MAKDRKTKSKNESGVNTIVVLGFVVVTVSMLVVQFGMNLAETLATPEPVPATAPASTSELPVPQGYLNV